MCPSYINLKIESVNNYYNMIQEATDDMKIDSNTNVNFNIRSKLNESLHKNTTPNIKKKSDYYFKPRFNHTS